MPKFNICKILCLLLLTSTPTFAQSLADVLSSIQERKQAIEQSKQLSEHLKTLNGETVTVPEQEYIEWTGLGTTHFPSDSDLASTGIDARIALLNQAIREFRTIQRSYLNIRAEDLTNDAKLGAIRPYMREDFADPGRVDASNYHAVLTQMAVQVLRLKVLAWPTAAKYNYHTYQVIKDQDDQEVVTYHEASNAQVEGFQPATIGPMLKGEEDNAGWTLTDPVGFMIELVDTQNVSSEQEDPNPEENGDIVKSLHCWMSGQLMSKAKLTAKVPGQDANTQIGAKVALVARSAWTPALEEDYAAPDPWKNTNAAYNVVTSATDSTEDIDIPSPAITLNLTWHANAGGGFEGNLSGYEEWWTGVDQCWANYYNDAYNMSVQMQLHRHVMAVAAPIFSKGLNAGGKADHITKLTKATAPTPGDAVPILHPSPGILLGIPIGTGLDGGQPAWIGWAPGDTLFHADAPNEFAGQLDEEENPYADQFANTILYPFHVQGARQIRFDYASNLRFIGAAQDFHVVYETSRAARGAGLPALSPTSTEEDNSGWNGDYDRYSEHFLFEPIDFFWKNQFFSAWEAPRLRQVVSRDFIIDITHTGHYSQTIKIYRRPADAGDVVRTPGTLATPDPVNLIRTLECSNPDAEDEALPAVAEKIVVMDGTTKYEVWKDGIEPNYAKNSQPLRFKLTEGENMRFSKVVEFPSELDAKVTTTIDGAPGIVEEISGSWPVIDLGHLNSQIADRKIGWNWWDNRAPLSHKRTAGSRITQINNTIDEDEPGSQKGAWPNDSDITVTNEPETNLNWNSSGRLVSAVQGNWKTDYAIESGALKAESKFSDTTYATNWTEWSNNDRTIKTYTAPDGSVSSKTSDAVDWMELTLGNSSGTGLPGLPLSLSRKDGTGATWAWDVSNDFSGSVTVAADTQSTTTAWNNRNYTISSQTSFIANGTVTVSNHAVPSGQTTTWGAPTQWKDQLTNLASSVAYEAGLNRPSSITSPLGLTTGFSNYDIFYRPGQVASNGITATNTYTALSTTTNYGGTGVASGSQSSYSTNIEGTETSSGLTWGGVIQSQDAVRGASSTAITGTNSLLGSSSATLRKDDGTTSAADSPTLAFGGVAGDALSIVNGLFVTKSAVAGQTGTFAETHTDAWGRTRKIVTPSKSSGSTQTTFDFSNPASPIKRIITTEPSGRVYITESEANGTINRSGIDVNGNDELGASDRYTESTTTIDTGKVVTTLKVTEDSGMREVLKTEWAPASGITVTKINGNEETITTTPNYAAKTVTASSDKGWSRTTALNNLGLETTNTLSGTGISTTDLKPVWRADGSLASVELDITTGENQKETHTASFNPDGTMASLTAPGRGNIFGGHSISNGVEALTVDGVTTERALDGTSLAVSGANVIGRSENLTTSGGGYKNTTTPAVGAATETTFNAAAAPTAKTYADNSGHSINYAGELPFEITLARGGAITLGYSNNGAKDLTSAVWPAVASGPFTIPSVGVGYGYNRSGNVNALTDPSGTRAINYQNGRTSGTTYTAGFLKGYEIIPGRDAVGRHTGTLIKRNGASIHSTAKALNGVSNQITNLASGNITATPQRDGAGRIIGYIWSDGTNSISQTWARGAGGRINSAESNVPGAPSFVYSIDENSFDAYGRRLKSQTAGGTWTYTYGAGGQITSATHPSLGSFNYSFDGIGRRTDKGEANSTDILNRTTAWTNSQDKTITIKAHPDARVWFNGVEIENFTGIHNAAVTPPGAEGGWVAWETLAVLEGAGEGAGDPAPNPLASPDAKAEKKGAVWVPPTAETLTYDAAGNRESSAQWNFGWDAKNQLTRARTKNHTNVPQAYDLTFSYDSEGRRVKKHVIEYRDGTQVSEKIVTFVWDGWDLLYERHQLPSGLTTLERKYLWGPDIADGQAGGAGGLLLIRETKGNTTTDIIPLYDGTGHVVALTDINKNLLASYAYGPFGEKISAEGSHAQSNPWRFQTKYRDEETGLYYFGYRVYDPQTGQWLSREPLGESESVNLYALTGNDPLNYVDVQGLRKKEIVSTDAKNRFRKNAKGEWEVRIVTVETGFWDNRRDYVREEWQPVSRNRLRLLGYAEFTENGGVATAGSDFIQAASAATGWDENAKKEGTLIAGTAMTALVAGPVAIAYGITAAPVMAGGASSIATEGGAAIYVYGGHALRTAWANPWVQATGKTAFVSMVAGTGYGVATDEGFRADYVALEMSTPVPGEGVAMGFSGLRAAGTDIKAAFQGFDYLGFAAKANKRLPIQILPEPAYVVPNNVPSSAIDDLESQLNKLYADGLELQKKLQTKSPAPLIPPVSYPNTVMVDIRSLPPLPGGRAFYDPLKLGQHGPFDWGNYTPIVVQYINGQPYVVNGMTRVENAIRSGIYQLPAEIIK